MADVRPSAIARIETFFRGWVHSDDATLGSGRFDLGRLNGALMTRPVKDALYYNGTAASVRTEWSLGAAGALSGSSKTIHIPLYVPTAAELVSTAQTLWAITGTPNGSTSADLGIFSYFDFASLSFNVRQYGPTISDVRRWNGPAGFVTTNGGRWGVLTLVIDAAAGTLSAYFNGVFLAPTVNDAVLSPSAWGVHSSAYFRLAGTDAPRFWTGPIGAPCLINAALSASDVLTLAQTGLLPTWCEAGTGSAVNKLTGDSSTFDAGVGSWVPKLSGSIVASGGKGVVTVGATYDGAQVSGLLTAGRRYRITVNVSDLVGDTNPPCFAQADGTALGSIALGNNTIEVTPNFTGALQIVRWSTTLTSFSIDNVAVLELGPIFKPVLDPNYGLRDLGANGIHGIRTAGISYIGEKADSVAVFKVTHSGSGNLQFAGGTALDTAKGWVLDTLIVKSTAAVTWSLGNASGGAQYVSGYSLAIGDNYIPSASLVTRLISGANLWSNSNGAADITIYATLRRTT
jgi:hypothetical protein